MAGNKLSIATEATGGVSATTQLNGATFVDATVKLGDRGDRLTAIAMHSAPEAALRKRPALRKDRSLRMAPA